jgi:hypothetical protein
MMSTHPADRPVVLTEAQSCQLSGEPGYPAARRSASWSRKSRTAPTALFGLRRWREASPGHHVRNS